MEIVECTSVGRWLYDIVTGKNDFEKCSRIQPNHFYLLPIKILGDDKICRMHTKNVRRRAAAANKNRWNKYIATTKYIVIRSVRKKRDSRRTSSAGDKFNDHNNETIHNIWISTTTNDLIRKNMFYMKIHKRNKIERTSNSNNKTTTTAHIQLTNK